MMLRSALFNALYFLWTAAVGLGCLPLLLSRPATRRAVHGWARGVMFLLRTVCGLRYEVRGTQYISSQPVIYACKHQSAWDIPMLLLALPQPVFVLKRELLRLPVVGWYMRGQGMIAVDRSGGAQAMKRMLKAGKRWLHEHRSLVIYPEGTRTAPGADAPYHPGVGALYTRLMVPVVPVALNSGHYWARNAFTKKPGTVVIEFLPPIPVGLSARELMGTLKERIEMASGRLMLEAGG